ncbi:hypothetical protein PHBOTO_005706 [Pseudozyma hubeiensis]|nr:hypothetical protein PHBOTO_005706 [Pseudozyma hubeiensis]
MYDNTQAVRKAQIPASDANIPNLTQLRSILSMVNKSPEAEEKSESHPLYESSSRAAHQAEEARQAEQLAQYLDQLKDDESSVSAKADPPFQAASERASDTLTDAISRSKPPARLGPPFKESKTVESSDDEDDLPLAERKQAGPCTSTLSGLTSRTKHLDSDDSDPDEDVPLQDLLRHRSSEAIASASSSIEAASKWSATFSPKVAKIFHGARGLSMKFLVPVASSALEGQDRARARSRAAAFDAAIGVSEQGRIVTFSEQPINRSPGSEADLPSHMMRYQAQDREKVKADRCSLPIDRVEDVSRLTSKVCGVASSTDKPLGLGNHDDYPCQVSLVTVDDTVRTHHTYHLDERPHAWGVASISHFPRTDPKDASSIDFATGGIDGIVNHWHWKSRSTKAETFRLHTLHDSKPIVALQHLSSRSNILASASIGTVIGYDLAALTLGFSWNTSDHIVHLERTPDPRLMLGVLARRDYDQFRMFDITGQNGPISRPVISFGWLNDSQGTLPLGSGSFHPTRRAIFAHGGEDGRVRVWDIRNARDPLIDERLADGPIVETVWAGSGKQGGEEDADRLYVATPKGVGSVSIFAP